MAFRRLSWPCSSDNEEVVDVDSDVDPSLAKTPQSEWMGWNPSVARRSLLTF